ncbi:uncharacterized protein LOC107413845 [Ziziphus jujuba]|uniref:Uncharacterized protein LOC107413845 n=2 Tax=Ziziphus jujuba TaxID=326968 RepID=A0A6P3ZGV3_ZIZJJ|nr:uncharacterized protein LOC107413845 [Ziziphus jujuba]KAH7545181.1 hypothetical protein FEM48_Zijuj01G0066400 [Ziziphus jujuba var. spinosa]
MANTRIARFITEVAPPQFVSVMRHRTSKVMDTINEEERDDSLASFSKGSSPTSAPTCSSSATSGSVSNYSACSSSATSGSVSNYYFLKEMRRSFPIFNH